MNYFVSYVYTRETGTIYEHACCNVDVNPPIHKWDCVEMLAKKIEEKFNFKQVIILNWKKYE
jgi:hypothetical protein